MNYTIKVLKTQFQNSYSENPILSPSDLIRWRSESLGEFVEVEDGPVCLLEHIVPLGNACKTHKEVRSPRLPSLQIGGAVANHDERLGLGQRLDMLGRPGLASCPGREFLVVEARIVARPGGKVNGVGKDVGLGDTELRRDGLNHQPESPGDEKDLLPLPVKRGHKLLHPRSESRGLLLEERLDGPFRRLNDRQPRAQRFLEGDRARHGLRGEPRHLLALPKVRREVVDALARADGAVNIEADHLGSGPESGDVAF
mmetsp:Transcript_6873/g.17773  ORF Transcript_6873/g.17773 Transcript_6873/m.17773 type:complete len:256 (-) Transcript_6873:236-1003(-)